MGLEIVPKGLPFPPTYSFPPTGRAAPDVAALGEGFQVIQSGNVLSVGGTSASAPTFAAVVSLLNEYQLQNGRKRLGFLNPWLYANPGMFSDVIIGTNAINRAGKDESMDGTAPGRGIRQRGSGRPSGRQW